jgi:sulfide dehydrogenase cytochrome subunit
MNGKSLGLLRLALGGAVMIASAWAGAGDNLESSIEGCESCHGKDGASEHEEMPVIGGMSAFYLDAQLRAYQDGYRPCVEIEYPEGPKKGEITDMCKEVKGLTGSEIENIAAYFSEKPFVSPEQEFDSALARTGQGIHDQHCRKCHSEGGGLAFDDAGILAGQWRPYLKHAFVEYREGERWQPEKMQPKIEALSEADIEALIEYYVSQEPVE